MAQSPAVPRPADERVARNPFAGRDYRWWWGMTLCTSLAVGVQLVTVPTFVLERTDTRFFVALAVLSQTAPAALFTLVGGAAADRFGRDRILRVTLALIGTAGVVFVLLSAADVPALWPVFALAAVVGTASAFQNPARQSLINRLAPGSRLQNGVIWGTLAWMGGQSFLGPALGGFTVRTFGLTAGFGVAVALLAAAVLCASLLPRLRETSVSQGGLAAQIRAGLAYVRADSRLWQVMLLGLVPGLFFIGVSQATFPVFVRETFGRSGDALAAGIGQLNAALGLGTLAGSVVLAWWGPRRARGRWFIWALPVAGAAFTLAGLAPSLTVATVCLVFWGVGAALFINFASTLLQTYTHQAYLGRVMSIYSLCVMGTVPLGSLQAGIGYAIWDARVVIVSCGVLSGLLGLLAMAKLRAVRALD